MNNIIEFATRTHKFNRLFITEYLVLNAGFKFILYTNPNQNHIYYGKSNQWTFKARNSSYTNF